MIELLEQSGVFVFPHEPGGFQHRAAPDGGNRLRMRSRKLHKARRAARLLL
jgi:hypothetical protein